MCTGIILCRISHSQLADIPAICSASCNAINHSSFYEGHNIINLGIYTRRIPEQSSDKNSQYGFLRNVIAVSIGAVVAVVAGVFSIAATLVSLLALPIVLLGFTLFNHPDVSCDRESSPRAGRLAICFDTSNVPPEPRNPEFIQRIATYVVNAANTAQSRHATTQPANEDINVAAEAQRPGIGERVQRAISMIAQAFSSSNTQPDTGAPSAICFGVESVSQGLATEPLQR